MIIQNFATIPIFIDPNNKRIKLDSDVLANNKINAIYLFASSASTILDPHQNIQLDTISSINPIRLFLNLFDNNDNHFIKDLPFLGQSFNGYTVGPGMSLAPYDINRLINIDKSHLAVGVTNETSMKRYLLCIIYQNQNIKPYNDVVNGSFSTNIIPTSEFQNIPLKTFVGDRLQNKLIKRIIINKGHRHSQPNTGYLDIFTKDGKRIENIPAGFLQVNGQRAIYFDNLDIDWDKSIYKQRGAYFFDFNDLAGNFIGNFYPNITFIY